MRTFLTSFRAHAPHSRSSNRDHKDTINSGVIGQVVSSRMMIGHIDDCWEVGPDISGVNKLTWQGAVSAMQFTFWQQSLYAIIVAKLNGRPHPTKLSLVWPNDTHL